MIIYLIMLVLQGCIASYLYLDDALFYISSDGYTSMQVFNQPSICNKYIVFFLVSFHNQMRQLVHSNCTEQNNADFSMLIQHTNHHVNKSVIVNQHVDSTYQPARHCISKREPTCQSNAPINTSVH